MSTERIRALYAIESSCRHYNGVALSFNTERKRAKYAMLLNPLQTLSTDDLFVRYEGD